MNCLVSIVIPAYNTQEYISEMLDCVINQTYKNLQIIVVDDGSKDNTRNIVESYAKKDSRIELISIPNGGVSNARNLGIQHANGEKLFLWDSDDLIEPNTIEDCLKFAKEKKVNAVLFGYGHCTNGIKGELHISHLKERYSGKEIIDQLLPCFLGHSFKNINNWIRGKEGLRTTKENTALWRVMLDTSVLKNSGLQFDTKLSLGEDTKFINQYFLLENTIGYLNKHLYYLRIRNNGANMTNISNPQLMLQNKIKLIKAREEITQMAKMMHNIDIKYTWEGTMVFSGVQLCLELSKNKKLTFEVNYKLFVDYINVQEVKEAFKKFKPIVSIKAIPFLLLKYKLHLILFIICYIMPKKIINKFI